MDQESQSNVYDVGMALWWIELVTLCLRAPQTPACEASCRLQGRHSYTTLYNMVTKHETGFAACLS